MKPEITIVGGSAFCSEHGWIITADEWWATVQGWGHMAAHHAGPVYVPA